VTRYILFSDSVRWESTLSFYEEKLFADVSELASDRAVVEISTGIALEIVCREHSPIVDQRTGLAFSVSDIDAAHADFLRIGAVVPGSLGERHSLLARLSRTLALAHAAEKRAVAPGSNIVLREES